MSLEQIMNKLVLTSDRCYATRDVKRPSLSLFGYPLTSPIGIAACAITTSTGIMFAAHAGYDVLTYKTIRSAASPINSSYMYRVACPDQLTKADIGKTLPVATHKADELAITNSFGINCMDRENTVLDIAKARAVLSEGQVLIVSIYGSGDTQKKQVDDFVVVARIAGEGGAQIIEANISCPNIGHQVPVYKQPDLVFEICHAITTALPGIPLTIKVGLFDTIEQMRATLHAAHRGGARGVCGINSVPMRVVTKEGNPVYGPERMLSGVSGKPILQLAKQFVCDARTIIDEEQLELILFATGGVTVADDFDLLLAAGADIVLSATGAMLNENLALDYHKQYTSSTDEHVKESIKKLYECGAIVLENTRLKSGQMSPIYCDVRRVISQPHVLKNLAQNLCDQLQQCTFDVVCGVPYGAVPLATAVSLAGDCSMIMQRKEMKEYGTKKLIEGTFKQGDVCVVIEDVVTTGASVLETIHTLESQGLVVRDVLVVVDREQGGVINIHTEGYNVHVVYTLSQIALVLLDEGLITHQQYARIKQMCANA